MCQAISVQQILFCLFVAIWWIHFFKKKDFIYLLLERREGREKERERNINVWLPLMHPLLGTWPATQAYVLTGNEPHQPGLKAENFILNREFRFDGYDIRAGSRHLYTYKASWVDLDTSSLSWETLPQADLTSPPPGPLLHSAGIYGVCTRCLTLR